MPSCEIDNRLIQTHAEWIALEKRPLLGLECGIRRAGCGENGRDLPFDLGNRFPGNRSPLDRE
jgi:hypothetical protein